MNKIVIGIDIGGSTTKIVAFDRDGGLIEPISVKADDPQTSAYGAFGKFTGANGIALSDIERVMITGVGSSFISDNIYGLECRFRPEFDCVGKGGLWLSGLDEALIVSMGTGTAMVYSCAGEPPVYLGGTGIGGGTLHGLGRIVLDVDHVEHLLRLAKGGDISKIDLRISDIASDKVLPGMPRDMTAANFGRLHDLATPEDKALGLLNMVFETVATCAMFAARPYGVKNIVLTGNLSRGGLASDTFRRLGEMVGLNFIIPERSAYATVIGAALGEKSER